MREVRCYNCDEGESRFYAAENGYTLVKCAGCGLLYVNPRPDDDEIDQAHRTGEHRGARRLEMTGAFRRQKVREYRQILAELYGDGASLRGKRWLDIGAGHGELLVALERFAGGAVRARGLEPNGNKRRAARRRGLDMSFFDLDDHGERYDVISLLNVYSHLPDPPAALASWRRLLEEGGELLLETGDTAHLAAADHPRPFYLPDHLSFASERIVVDVLEDAGFEVVEVRKYPLLTPSAPLLAKEAIKLAWPGKRSRLGAVMKSRLYREVDMYVRARLPG